MAGGIKPPKRLEVRSNTLVGTNGPSVTTERGTRDPMMRIGDAPRTGPLPMMPPAGQGTADVMPEARGFTNMPWAGSGPKTLPDQYLSWKLLQGQQYPMGSSPTEGMMAGAGGMSDHQPMPGVVPKNKAPF